MTSGKPAVSSPTPMTKAARHARIASILETTPVRSQEELLAALGEAGVTVTQATLSRDLDELGAVRLRAASGGLVYALPGGADAPGARPGGMPGRTQGAGPGSGGHREHGPARPSRPAQPDVVWPEAAGSPQSASRLARVCAELLTAAEASANLVVLRTPAGAAQYLASVLDHANWTSILGTVAGDDTVLVVTRDPAGGTEVADRLLRLAERRP
jgi:transcriptional regulator of arginine metabolism